MKREPRSKPQSHSGSVAGDEADFSDIEPSESGSLGGQSYLTNSGSRKRMTIEEREAAYNEARSRIFMDFEEKEKGKEMNATSSTLSVSGSTSSTGRSYMGDTDDAVSSPATESEWSMPTNTFYRDPKREVRRGTSASASSSRAFRNGGSFNGNSSGNNSRNSRAPSPSFSYPTLFEQTLSGPPYDPSHLAANPGYVPAQYGFPYPPNQGLNPPYSPPYPYYAPHYPFQPPSMSQHNPLDSSPSAGPEIYHQTGYMPPYGWAPQPPPSQPPMPPITHMHPQIPPPHLQNPMNQIGPMPPPPAHAPPYPPYPPHAYPYPVNPMSSYYPPPGPPGQHGQGLPPPQMTLPPQPHPGYDPRAPNPNATMCPPLEIFRNNSQYNSNVNYNSGGGYGPSGGLGNGIIQPAVRPISHRSSSSGSGNSHNNNDSKRVIPAPSASRPTWNSAPGSGFPYHVGGVGMNESIGPRFNSLNKRTSGNTSSGGNSCASSTTNGDDVSSIAVSILVLFDAHKSCPLS